MIVVREVSKHFGAVAALREVSLQVASASRLVIKGPSGAGKTTLLRLIAGLELPDRGEISIGGQCVSHPDGGAPPHRRGIGFVFQSSALWPHMTVSQNILFGLGHLPRSAARERLAQLLEESRLSHLAQRYPDQISGGEARRVAIARSLAPRPPILLLDEPLIHLDADLRSTMLGVIRRQVEQTHACLIYVSHDHQESAAVDGTVATLEGGRLFAQTPSC